MAVIIEGYSLVDNEDARIFTKEQRHNDQVKCYLIFPEPKTSAQRVNEVLSDDIRVRTKIRVELMHLLKEIANHLGEAI